MKDRYFPHDYGARLDEKLIKAQMKFGISAYGVYFCLLEKLWENQNQIENNCELLAYELRADAEIIRAIINDYDLFKINTEGFIYSESINSRVDKISKSSDIKRQNAFKRWNKNAKKMQTPCKDDAKPMQNDAIKETKLNETKETKEIKLNETKEINTFKNLQTNFFDFFKSKYNQSYQFNGQDGKQLKNLIARLKNAIKNKKNEEPTEEDMQNGFKHLLNIAFNDKWLNQNFSISNINSKFNDILTKNGKQAGESANEKYMRGVREEALKSINQSSKGN